MAYQWRFFRAGGFDQVQITRGADLAALGELDQKLWVALACPVQGLAFDQRTLELIDTDRDGRVRVTELVAATKWVAPLLKDVETLAARKDSIALSAISDAEQGALIRKTAVSILEGMGKSGATEISVADTAAAVDAFAKQPFNGDGIVHEDTASDDASRQVIAEILACSPQPRTDRSGRAGIDSAMIGAFYDALAARAAWLDAGSGEEIRPLGAETAAAFAALRAVRGKIDDFFARCRLAAFDPRALDAVNGEEKEYLAIASKELHASVEEVAHFPIARVTPEGTLPLIRGLNPAWTTAVAALRDRVVAPLLGERSELDEAAWQSLCARFAGYETWTGAEAGAAVASLPEARVRELLSGGQRAALEALVARDAEAEPMAKAIESVERLVRYCRDLMPLANNFVAFRDFYGRRGPATFQVGTLYIDQRACELCIRVNDAGKHATMAPLSSAYLLYCDLKNAAGDKMTIVAAVTNGDVDNLMVGRNGVFYDRDGKDWDATVTKIVENPISIRQAFWSPYKRFLRSIETMITQRAEASAKASEERVAAAAMATGEAATGKAVEAPKTFDVGTVAALGVAVGGITAALGALLNAFFGLGLWMPLGVLGMILLISGPSMAVAWLKLRQRNLGPLLDANGWAVNAQAKLNVPLGEALTQVAALPPGSSRDVVDQYAERRRPWWLYTTVLVVLALAVGWYIGSLDRYLPGPVKSTSVMGSFAPASNVPVAEPAPAPEAPPAE